MFVFNIRKIKRPLLLGVLVITLGITTGLVANQFLEPSEQPVIQLKEQEVEIKELPAAASIPIRKNAESDLVMAYRIERQRFLSKNTETLQKLVDDEKQSKEVREQAALRLVNLLEKSVQEGKIEFLIKAAGIENCVIMLEGDKINVLLSEALAEERAEALKQTVGTAVSYPKENVNLISP